MYLPSHYFMGSLRVCGEIEPHWGFIVITLKRTPGDIVVTFQDTFWKKSQWVAQAHGRHIANKIVKEPRVFIQNVPSGYFHSGHWAPFCPRISHVYKTTRLNFLCIFPISLLFENTLENQSKNSMKMWDILMGNIMIGGLWLAHTAEYFG